MGSTSVGYDNYTSKTLLFYFKSQFWRNKTPRIPFQPKLAPEARQGI